MNSRIAVVNGYHIRPTTMEKFGRVFFVEGTKKAFITLDMAKKYAEQLPFKEYDDEQI